jgi:Phage integrase family
VIALSPGPAFRLVQWGGFTSFASFLVNEGVSLYVVQALLGHANARTTQRYAHLASDTLTDAAEIVDGIVAAQPRMVTPPGAAQEVQVASW